MTQYDKHKAPTPHPASRVRRFEPMTEQERREVARQVAEIQRIQREMGFDEELEPLEELTGKPSAEATDGQIEAKP